MSFAEIQASSLYDRRYNLTIGVPPSNAPNAAELASIVATAGYKSGAQGLDISGFDAEFDVKRSLKPEPPSATIRVYNLPKNVQLALSGSKALVVQLQAGYQGTTTLIYFATCSSAITQRVNGKDIVTTFESGDAEVQFATARLNAKTSQHKPTVPVGIALQSIVDALGVNQGNAFSVIGALENAGVKSVPGSALSGAASRRLTDLLASVGYGWSIQNGSLQILGVDATINAGQAIVLSESSGMIESPSVDTKGVLSAKALIIPGLLPGALVKVDGEFMQGTFRVYQTRHVGETAGKPWYVEIEGTKYA